MENIRHFNIAMFWSFICVQDIKDFVNAFVGNIKQKSI